MHIDQWTTVTSKMTKPYRLRFGTKIPGTTLIALWYSQLLSNKINFYFRRPRLPPLVPTGIIYFNGSVAIGTLVDVQLVLQQSLNKSLSFRDGPTVTYSKRCDTCSKHANLFNLMLERLPVLDVCLQNSDRAIFST